MSSTLPRRLLHATYASLRCRELCDAGKVVEARIELDLLRQALRDLQAIELGGQSRREFEFLRGQEQKLTRVLESAIAGAGRRSTPSDAPPGAG